MLLDFIVLIIILTFMSLFIAMIREFFVCVADVFKVNGKERLTKICDVFLIIMSSILIAVTLCILLLQTTL